jgi:hypothetical protein
MLAAIWILVQYAFCAMQYAYCNFLCNMVLEEKYPYCIPVFILQYWVLNRLGFLGFKSLIRLLFVAGFRPLSGLLFKIACKCSVGHDAG